MKKYTSAARLERSSRSELHITCTVSTPLHFILMLHVLQVCDINQEPREALDVLAPLIQRIKKGGLIILTLKLVINLFAPA